MREVRALWYCLQLDIALPTVRCGMKRRMSTVGIVCLLAGLPALCLGVPQKHSSPSPQVKERLNILAHHTKSVMLEGMGADWKKTTGLDFNTLISVQNKALLAALVSSLRFSHSEYQWDSYEGHNFVRIYFRTATANNALVEVIYRKHVAYCTGEIVNTQKSMPASKWQRVPLTPRSAQAFAEIVSQIGNRGKHHDAGISYVQGGPS